MTTTPRHSTAVAGRVVVVVVVLLLILAGILAWRIHHDDTYVVPPNVARSGRPALEQPGEAAAALAALQQAVAAHAPDAVAGSIAKTVVANASTLRVEDFTARYVAPEGAVSADGSWTADVAVTWRFADVDAETAAEDISVSFAPAGKTVTIAGFGGGDERLPLWLAGPVQVRRTATTMVVLEGTGAEAERRADRFDRLAVHAVAAVRKVVPWPDPHLVLEVPQTESGLEQMMGVDQGSFHGVAAVTATVDGSANGPVHVLVNPQVIGGLNSAGAQIVLSHEATHDATGVATNDTMPPWLIEGFADYVALRDVNLPLSTTARQILAQVRKDGPPAHLPGRAQFNDQADDFGTEYEAAWLACRLLSSTGGEQALVKLYDDVRGGADVDRSMRKDFGFSLARFTGLWRQQLRTWAR